MKVILVVVFILLENCATGYGFSGSNSLLDHCICECDGKPISSILTCDHQEPPPTTHFTPTTSVHTTRYTRPFIPPSTVSTTEPPSTTQLTLRTSVHATRYTRPIIHPSTVRTPEPPSTTQSTPRTSVHPTRYTRLFIRPSTVRTTEPPSTTQFTPRTSVQTNIDTEDESQFTIWLQIIESDYSSDDDSRIDSDFKSWLDKVILKVINGGINAQHSGVMNVLLKLWHLTKDRLDDDNNSDVLVLLKKIYSLGAEGEINSISWLDLIEFAIFNRNSKNEPDISNLLLNLLQKVYPNGPSTLPEWLRFIVIKVMKPEDSSKLVAWSIKLLNRILNNESHKYPGLTKSFETFFNDALKSGHSDNLSAAIDLIESFLTKTFYVTGQSHIVNWLEVLLGQLVSGGSFEVVHWLKSLLSLTLHNVHENRDISNWLKSKVNGNAKGLSPSLLSWLKGILTGQGVRQNVGRDDKNKHGGLQISVSKRGSKNNNGDGFTLDKKLKDVLGNVDGERDINTDGFENTSSIRANHGFGNTNVDDENKHTRLQISVRGKDPEKSYSRNFNLNNNLKDILRNIRDEIDSNADGSRNKHGFGSTNVALNENDSEEVHASSAVDGHRNPKGVGHGEGASGVPKTLEYKLVMG